MILKRLSALLPLAIFFAALAPRLAGLGQRPFWYDEVLTAWRTTLPLPFLIRNSFISQHTPLYFLLLSPIAHWPDAQFWLRLPSAILGALNVMLVFLIGVRAGGRTAGIAAALIVGLAPTEIAYSQEARSYMLMIFFLLVALHALTRLAQNAERAALPWRAGGQGWVWLQFIAGSTAALCTLADSLPWLLAAGITAGFMIASVENVRNRSGLLRNFLIAAAISLAACLPLYATMVHLGPSYVVSHGPRTTPGLIWYDIESLYLMRVCDFMSRHFMAVPTPQVLIAGIGAGIAAATLGGIWRLRRNPAMAAVLLPAAFTLPVFFGFFSIWKPILAARYLLWSAPAFAILAGLGISAILEKLPASARRGALAVTALVLLVNLLPYYHIETKPRWDIATQIFAAQAQPQDVAYYADPGGELTMRYYLPPAQTKLLMNYAANLQQAEQARAQGKRLWAFYGDAWNRRIWKSQADFQASLAPLGTPSAELHAGSRITIWVYEPVVK